jgi:flagellin-like protein
MLDKYTNKSIDRGQVGIGTLIVFIALVLVAAIAAGVLINVAGLLQEQGENTGEESVEEVSNQVIVTNAYGETGGSGDVTSVDLKVRKASGSDNIDLSRSSVEYLGPDGQATLAYSDSPSGDFSLFGVSADIDDDSTVPILTQTSDRFVIEFDLDSSGSNTPASLSERDEFKVEIITESGASTEKTLTVPKNTGNNTTVELE